MKEIFIKMLEGDPEEVLGKFCDFGNRCIFGEDSKCSGCPFDNEKNLKKLIEELKEEK